MLTCRTPGYLTYYLAPKFMNDYVAMIRLRIHLFPFEFLFLGFSNFVHSVESLPRIYYFCLFERLAHKPQNLLGLQQRQDERW
jgi:hypothetical protein